MNYEEQILGLRKIIVEMQKKIAKLELDRDQTYKLMADEAEDVTKNFKHVRKYLKTIYSAVNPIEAKIFPAARTARRQAAALEKLNATSETFGGKKH